MIVLCSAKPPTDPINSILDDPASEAICCVRLLKRSHS